MRIVVVNTHDIQGGAARAANRLYKGLLDAGIECFMLVQTKSSRDANVIGPKSKISKLMARLRPLIDHANIRRYKNRSHTLFSRGVTGDSHLVDKINALKPDIVHLHWINEGFLSIKDISAIKAPIVWSLHDMWPFTGGCHYDEWCGAYQTGCGKCKVLGSVKKNDLSRRMFQLKQQSYANKNITIVGLSQWLAQEAAKSPLFANKTIVNLPNPIDTTEFCPLDKKFARNLFNLPVDRKLILFGAMGATSDPRKGFNQLVESLEFLDEHYELVVFGAETPNIPQGFRQKAHYLGVLNDNVSLKALYNAADVMVVPSMQENLSNAIMESLSCGTPVVAFAVGGNSDMISHKKNGYLVKPFDTKEMAHGINYMLTNIVTPEQQYLISSEASEHYSMGKVIPGYLDLYQSIMEANKGG